jgi:type IV pilus assembly protein PilX
MLNRTPYLNRQKGIVLILALIVLVAMSLAGIGLMRSVMTSNRVASNLAFQQSAALSAGVGLEQAIAWLERANGETNGATPPVPKLNNHVEIIAPETVAYRANRADPASGQTWEAFWSNQGLAITTLPEDGAGNVVSFMINRLCLNTGSPTGGADCEASPVLNSATETSSKGTGIKLTVPSQVYYRITVRVVGPRNAVAFSQAVVAL